MTGGDRRRVLAQYPMGLPDDFFAFADFAAGLDLDEALGIGLGPAFGSGDDAVRRSRYRLDPPELLTMLHGDTDGLHWGYWVDDPGALADAVVVSYFHNDAFAISTVGRTLLEAVRLHLEQRYGDATRYADEDPGNRARYERDLERLDGVRAHLVRFGTGEWGERGQDYVAARHGPERVSVADTVDGMGIVVPAGTYRPPDAAPEDPDDYRAEGRRALDEGYAGTALKVGRDLWVAPGGFDDTCRLLDGAYAALGREFLRETLRLAAEQRRDAGR